MNEVLKLIQIGSAIDNSIKRLTEAYDKAKENGDLPDPSNTTISMRCGEIETNGSAELQMSFYVCIEVGDRAIRIAAQDIEIKSGDKVHITTLDDLRGFECDCAECKSRRIEHNDLEKQNSAIKQANEIINNTDEK